MLTTLDINVREASLVRDSSCGGLVLRLKGESGDFVSLYVDASGCNEIQQALDEYFTDELRLEKLQEEWLAERLEKRGLQPEGVGVNGRRSEGEDETDG